MAEAAAKATRTQAAQKTPARAAKTYTANAARARRARLARARAAARARDMREAQTPRFKIDEFGQEVPDVRAEAAIIYNPVTREVLWSSNAESERSIASITKVMTALVILESGIDLADAGHGAAERRVPRLHHLPARAATRSRSKTCSTCCSSAPTTPPPARWRASRRTAPTASSIA